MGGKYWVAIDIGGTFTDGVLIDGEGNMQVAKTPSLPGDPIQGVLNCIRGLAESQGLSVASLLQDTHTLAHGTTEMINAFVQLRGARVGFITTKGFEDHFSVMKGGRGRGLPAAEKQDYARILKHPPMVAGTVGVIERIDYTGRVLVPLDAEDARTKITQLIEEKDIEAIAINLLFGWKNPVHEQALKKILAELRPHLLVTTASELLPVIGEYERSATVITNAYLAPVLARYAKALGDRLRDEGFARPVYIMQSNGGLIPSAEAVPMAVTTLVSGLAGGVKGAQQLGSFQDRRNVVTCDMGGTSFEVGIVYEGDPVISHNPLTPRLGSYVSRHALGVPMLDITAIGSGGGSIAWIDHGALRVGPLSAGADPGPVCYGKGGREPTVTDANLVLGYLNPNNFLGGRMKVYKEKSEEAIMAKIGRPLGLSLIEAARGIYTVVNNQMADLLRNLTIGRGYDPRDFVLIVFGGSGPVHCGALAKELGARKTIIPGTGLSSAFSAYGVATSDLAQDFSMTDVMDFPLDMDRARATLSALREHGVAVLRGWGVPEKEMVTAFTVDMRYRTQVHEIPIPVYMEDSGEALADRFGKRYEALYGPSSAYPEGGIECVNWRVHVRGASVKPRLRQRSDGVVTAESGESFIKERRNVVFDRDEVYAPVFDGSLLSSGFSHSGASIIEFWNATVVVQPDRKFEVDAYGNIVLT